MSRNKLEKEILSDISKTYHTLRKLSLLRDENPTNVHSAGKERRVSFVGKSDANRIMYDEHLCIDIIHDALLKSRQYNLLLYDKSIIQAEFIIESNTIVKERLLFVKRQNKIWTPEEIRLAESDDIDWLEESEGIPIVIRVDFDNNNYEDCNHPISHLTLSNCEPCRIPLKKALSFSSFIKFIFRNFYDIDIELEPYKFGGDDTITAAEKKLLHINWE